MSIFCQSLSRYHHLTSNNHPGDNRAFANIEEIYCTLKRRRVDFSLQQREGYQKGAVDWHTMELNGELKLLKAISERQPHVVVYPSETQSCDAMEMRGMRDVV